MTTKYIPFNDDIAIKVSDIETPLKVVNKEEFIFNNAGNAELLAILNDALDAANNSIIFDSPYGLLHSSLFIPVSDVDERILKYKYDAIFTLNSKIALLLRYPEYNDGEYYLSTIEKVLLDPPTKAIN